MNSCKVLVKTIRSYQTLIGEKIICKGKFGFSQKYQKTEYKEYQKELEIGLLELTPISSKLPIRAIITFNMKEGVDLPVYRVKMIESGVTRRNFSTEEEALNYMDKEKHYIEFEDYTIKYGKGDEDNLTKPIYDTMTMLGIIPDDRFIRDSHKKFTYNNKENSIDIELKEMKVVVKDNGQYIFE